MYVIFLTPKSKAFTPHYWAEGGYMLKDNATKQAKSIRKMRDIYKNVEVRKATGWEIL